MISMKLQDGILSDSRISVAPEFIRAFLNSDANREDASSSACDVGMSTGLVNVSTVKDVLDCGV